MSMEAMANQFAGFQEMMKTTRDTLSDLEAWCTITETSMMQQSKETTARVQQPETTRRSVSTPTSAQVDRFERRAIAVAAGLGMACTTTTGQAALLASESSDPRRHTRSQVCLTTILLLAYFLVIRILPCFPDLCPCRNWSFPSSLVIMRDYGVIVV
jgi:hypothetical protein